MKSVARTLSPVVLAVLSLSCNPDQVSAPLPEPLFHKTHGGNPDCQLSRLGKSRNPVDFLCAIQIPGNPLTSSQKGWAEQSNGMYFLSDASNFGVDVVDIRTHTYVGRVTGFAGNLPSGGGTATTNGAGPSSFVSAPARRDHRGHGRDHDDDDDWGRRGHRDKRRLWVSDGNSTVHVVDMDDRRIIASVSTAIPACDGGTATTKYCGRANEIGYDPVHHVILVSNPAPLTLGEPHVLGDGYATFISADPPYEVLGHVAFPGAGNVEGHVWVPELRRFLLPIQPTNANQATKGTMYIAVINARTREIEDKRVYYCPEIPGTVPTSTGNNNLQLASGHNLWGQICGRPIRMDVRTGEILTVIAEVGTGDQDWYNPGDGNFYVSGNELRPGMPTGTQLGVIDARRGVWLQNVPNTQGGSPSAYARTNEIFMRATVNAAMVADPTLDLSRCAVKGRGCVLVFAHLRSSEDNQDPD